MTDHAIYNRPLDAAMPQGYDRALFAMGPYRRAEALFWHQHGIWLTEAGFIGGHVDNPSPAQVAQGDTGHAEAVRIIFDSSQISYDHLLKLFWENHDPTGDGDQRNCHRSLIMVFNDSQRVAAEAARVAYDNRLAVKGFPAVTTRILDAGPFWPAPAEDQQYLAKHPGSDCSPAGTGIQAAMPEPDVS